MDMVVRWQRVSRSAVVEVNGRGELGGSELTRCGLAEAEGEFP
jgi:molybdenum-dependent DNA-binding transcriptional regulator ModE